MREFRREAWFNQIINTRNKTTSILFTATVNNFPAPHKTYNSRNKSNPPSQSLVLRRRLTMLTWPREQARCRGRSPTIPDMLTLAPPLNSSPTTWTGALVIARSRGKRWGAGGGEHFYISEYLFRVLQFNGNLTKISARSNEVTGRDTGKTPVDM